MQKTVSKLYLETLKNLNDWVTVSEWAEKFGKDHPKLLEKADKEAKNHQKESTGVREIAARISSNISRGAYSGLIQINDEEKPRVVKYINNQDEFISKEIEQDLEPITRARKIKTDLESITAKDQYRIEEFEAIISQLRSFFHLDFELEHAKALLNQDDPGSHHPDNIQILLKSHNRIKNNKNWKRFTIDEQIEYLNSVVKVQKLVSKQMNIDLDISVIEKIIQRLKLVY